MRHLFRCPLRWADLDLLGHVNNVTYADYLQEARVDLFRTHAPDVRAEALAEGAVVVRHEVTYVSSLTFRLAPVSIEVWVSDLGESRFTLDYEIFDDTDPAEPGSGRTVYLRARTELAPYVFAEGRTRPLSAVERAALEVFLEPGDPMVPIPDDPVVDLDGGSYPVHVRFSDVDAYGHVNDVPYFEYFQEARIVLMMERHRGLAAEQGLHLVVARTDIDYRQPLLLRADPYDCRTWVSRVGRTSVVFDSVVLDEGRVLSRARVVGVCIDSSTGRPAPVPEAYRELVTPAC